MGTGLHGMGLQRPSTTGTRRYEISGHGRLLLQDVVGIRLYCLVAKTSPNFLPKQYSTLYYGALS